MNSIATISRLYEACGFRAKPLMSHRLLGFGALELSNTIHSDEFGEEKGGPEQFVGVAGLSPENYSGPLRNHHDIAFERKMWRAYRITRLISHLPFVRAVAVCNSLGFQMAHEESDIDLLIITASNRVWSARWWVTGVLALLRMRPGEAVRDPVCVSFFVDEHITDLSAVMMERDVYFYYWLRSLMPLYGTHSLFSQGARTAPEFRVKRGIRFIQLAREFFPRLLLENFVRQQQMNIMSASVKRVAELEDTTVVLTDRIIKLHQNDRRKELRDKVFS